MLMYVTWAELLQFVLLLVSIVALSFQIKKK